MASKTGANTLVGLKLATTWASPVECGAGDKMPVESINMSNNTSELSDNNIGDGNDLTTGSIPGNTNPTASIGGKMFYDGPYIEALALLMGSASVAAEGDGYKHTITYNPDRANVYATIAREITTTDVQEMQTGLPSSYNISIAANSYANAAIEFLGNDIVTEPDESTANTTATMANLTNADTNKIIVRPTDGLWINAQSAGALSISNCESFVDLSMNFVRGLEIVNEVRCAAGNGLPRSSGEMPFMVNLPINFRALDKTEYFNAVKAEDRFKAQYSSTGALIGGTTYYKFTAYFPGLQVPTDPDGAQSNTVENPYSTTFKAYNPGSAPTGMDYAFPYIEIINDRADAYLL